MLPFAIRPQLPGISALEPNPVFGEHSLVVAEQSTPSIEWRDRVHAALRLTGPLLRRCEVHLYVHIDADLPPGMRRDQFLLYGRIGFESSEQRSEGSVRIDYIDMHERDPSRELEAARFVLKHSGLDHILRMNDRFVEPIDPGATQLRQGRPAFAGRPHTAQLLITQYPDLDEARHTVERYLESVGATIGRVALVAEIPDESYDALRPVLNDALSWWTYQGTGMLRPGIETYEGMMAGVAEGVDWVPLFMHEGRVTVDGVQQFTTKVVAACPSPDGVRLEINCDWLDPERIMKQVTKATGLEWELIVPPPERGEVHA